MKTPVGTRARNSALAAIIMPDSADGSTPPDGRNLKHNVFLAVKHVSLLMVIYFIVVIGRSSLEATPSPVLHDTKAILVFCALFLLIDVFILTFWYKMSEQFVQAGFYYVVTILFSSLKFN